MFKRYAKQTGSGYVMINGICKRHDLIMFKKRSMLNRHDMAMAKQTVCTNRHNLNMSILTVYKN